MADSSTPLDSEGHLFITANMGAGVGAMYHPFEKGLLSRGALIDSQNTSAFGPIIGSEFLMRDIVDSGTSTFLGAGANAYGQQLIMDLDSDASNASGGEGGGSGITQYWIG